MTRIVFSLALVLSLGAAVAVAQQSNSRRSEAAGEEVRAEGNRPAGKTTPARTATARRTARNAAATPAPAATPARKGFFQRIFGRRSTPAPVATAPSTPAPKATPRSRRVRSGRSAGNRAEATTASQAKDNAADASESTPPEGQKPENASDSEMPPDGEAAAPVGETTSDVAEKKNSAQSTPPAARKKGDQRTAAVKQPPTTAAANDDPEAQEKAKFDEAKAKAMEDEQIQALKKKADTAPDGEEGRKALRAFNKALFGKMRRIDSSITERINAMESAMMKRLEE